MAVLVESAPQKVGGAVVVPGESKQEDVRGTRIKTRVHQRQCVRCKRWFWAWDPERLRCFLCDAPPPGELKRILDAIHGPNG